MPGRNYRRGFGRRRGAMSLNVINSIKNQVVAAVGTTGTKQKLIIAKAVNTPLSTNNNDVSNGCIIKAIWLSLDGCGLGGTGVLNNQNFYIMKNPGDNLTEPSPISWGTSNEKKFIFKSWKFMIMRNQDGNVPFHWEGWIRIPKLYQRMGTDDTIILEVINTAAVTGHFSMEAIYKWYR